ncbi:double-strand break repair helicase AddA [Hyphococcus sp. DH-69]|uniref:double-strand break repair helicase AddA n=1 Tax=Hyphococcus formosus TaxID=3143534 RepID=UPI00398A9CB4
MTPLQETTDNQRHAAHPARSVFVMANAGSGKTRVLTNRVARLLLSGAEPEKILCITFTKAAAAEMAERLFSVLGEWALASDNELIEALKEIEGDDAEEKTPDQLAQARRLFARALETPGGLKIQTIHSFCESVLRRFPIEAGAPPGFTVIEDAQALGMRNSALDALAIRADDDPQLRAAFTRLSATRKEKSLRDLLLSGLKPTLEDIDVDAALAALGRELLIDPKLSEDQIKADFIGRLSKDDLQCAHNGLAADGKQPQDAAKRLAPYFSASGADEKWDILCAFLLTADRSKLRSRIATAATDKVDPWVGPFLKQLAQDFEDTLRQLKKLAFFQDTAAHFRLCKALFDIYAAAKSDRAALDFDDLIVRTRQLFSRVNSAWIMFKLDYGVDHILIDEAQDTSPNQWAVVESLFEDYFSGAGARLDQRSFFAVGDMKQSIYSFQGADVGLFQAKEIDLGRRLEAVTDYKNLKLKMSFRTTEPVLKFVDEVFSDKEAAEGLGEFPIPEHGVCREGQAGLVELWPLTPRPESETVNVWDAPVDAPAGDHPVRVLCEKIASTIKGWLDRDEILQSSGKPIRPGDIMILVQSRSTLFREVIQRLSAQGVPVAGPDRLVLLEDPVIEDLLSYARFALNQSDDLSLAEILKSPLFGFDDDNDLFPLAYDREYSLWAELRKRASENPKWKTAFDEISLARDIARQQGPFAFFNHILETGTPSGRQRFYRRLGEVSSDAMDELLRQAIDFENASPRSLREFLSWFEKSATDIKREMDRQNDAVRVMTVHGAKGLEADVVFLLDAHREVRSANVGPLFAPPSGTNLPDGLTLLAGSKTNDVDLTDRARQEKLQQDYEEYRRLFYVAATRARDRLYICGVQQGNNKNPNDKETGVKSWHALSIDAFERLGKRAKIGAEGFWPNDDSPVMRISCPQTAKVKPSEKAIETTSALAAPDWMFEKAPAEGRGQRLTPSKLLGEEDLEAQAPAYSPVLGESGGDKYFRGRIIHRLLELLPEVAAEVRSEAADRLLARLAQTVSPDERDLWRDEVLTVLTDEKFSAVFAPGSRAEVPIVGRPANAPADLRINGQIDRLVITEKQVLVVDYKTNRPPPHDVVKVDPTYVAQMAAYRALLQEIYPEHEIICALLWTFDARLMELPGEILDHAFARIKSMG